MARQSHSSPSSFSYGFTYQVFLNFRGADTRNGLTGNLYKALIDKGIHTFMDDSDIQRGDEITPSILKAIDESRIFVPVFSINYASSSFCLDELVHIIHCYQNKGCLVLPIFFGVDPSHVRRHRGSYGEALAKYEERVPKERLDRWKMALTKAANLSGYHYTLGYDYIFIEKIVNYISSKINFVPLHVANYPVGLESQVQQVVSLLNVGSDTDVRMVGLYGIGGLGKSTLAKAIYNFIGEQFEGSCFLENVRENSASNNLKCLQEELLLKTLQLNIKLGGVSEGIPNIKVRLHRKKILLILDDVDNMKQLQALAGGLDWFGSGSRVIITTRDKHLLTTHGIESIYSVEGLYKTESLELFRWVAFKNGKVPSCYEEILDRAVVYASGLPLVIEIVGSNLFGKSIEEWKYTLDGYEKIPNEEIQKIFRKSYDALEEEEKSVFLDIACCFKGCRWAEVKDILHAHYGHCINHHLRTLAEKSLIDQYYDHVTLHVLIENMGKEVVRQESPKEPRERSRLWCLDDIAHVLKENMGTSKIEMIYMNFPSMEAIIDWNGHAFKKMTKLRTLIIENVHFPKGLKYLPSSLRVFKWKRYPGKSLSTCFLNKKFVNMKVLTLDHCQYLTDIPNVSDLPNLEKCSFEYCDNLITIHDSIGHLNKLEILSSKGCSKLESFPPLWLASLKELELSKCKNLKSFPELFCKMTNIKEILLDETFIEELPFSFLNLSELNALTIYHGGMFRFSSNICRMPKLSTITVVGRPLLMPKDYDNLSSTVSLNVEYLNLGQNLSDESLPIVLTLFANVKHLNLSENNFKILPECLSECHLLRILELDSCWYLEEIRGFPRNLEKFSAIKCESLNSSSKRMLMSQQLHEDGCSNICLPTGTEGIPDWFEHQVRGDTISFWCRKKIPSITCILVIPESVELPEFNLFVKGYKCTLSECLFCYSEVLPLPSEHAFLFELDLKAQVDWELVDEMNGAHLPNKWIHVELNLENDDFSEDKKKILSSVAMGIHVWKEKSNMEEDVIFNDPYSVTISDED